MTIKTKSFTFDIASNNEPTVELIQLISLAIELYDGQNGKQPADIASAIKYFNSMYA